MRRICALLLCLLGCKAPPPAMPKMDLDELAARQAVAFVRCFEHQGAECRQDGPRKQWVALGLLARLRSEIPTAIVENFDASVDELSSGVAVRRGWLRELEAQEHWVRKAGCQIPQVGPPNQASQQGTKRPTGVAPLGAQVRELVSDAEDRLVGLGLGDNDRARVLATAAEEATNAFKEARLVEFGCAEGRRLFVVLAMGQGDAFVPVSLLTSKPWWLEKRTQPVRGKERLKITPSGENLIDPWLPVFEEQI